MTHSIQLQQISMIYNCSNLTRRVMYELLPTRPRAGLRGQRHSLASLIDSPMALLRVLRTHSSSRLSSQGDREIRVRARVLG